MASLLQRGAEWLAGKLKDTAIAGESITYTRGGDSVTLTATPGKSLLRVMDSSGNSVVEWTDADWLISAADLILAGSTTLPERGDIITRTKGGTVYTYEVRPVESEGAWRWSDENRTIMRVHTKEIATS